MEKVLRGLGTPKGITLVKFSKNGAPFFDTYSANPASTLCPFISQFNKTITWLHIVFIIRFQAVPEINTEEAFDKDMLYAAYLHSLFNSASTHYAKSIYILAWSSRLCSRDVVTSPTYIFLVLPYRLTPRCQPPDRQVRTAEVLHSSSEATMRTVSLGQWSLSGYKMCLGRM